MLPDEATRKLAGYKKAQSDLQIECNGSQRIDNVMKSAIIKTTEILFKLRQIYPRCE